MYTSLGFCVSYHNFYVPVNFLISCSFPSTGHLNILMSCVTYILKYPDVCVSWHELDCCRSFWSHANLHGSFVTNNICSWHIYEHMLLVCICVYAYPQFICRSVAFRAHLICMRTHVPNFSVFAVILWESSVNI